MKNTSDYAHVDEVVGYRMSTITRNMKCLRRSLVLSGDLSACANSKSVNGRRKRKGRRRKKKIIKSTQEENEERNRKERRRTAQLAAAYLELQGAITSLQGIKKSSYVPKIDIINKSIECIEHLTAEGSRLSMLKKQLIKEVRVKITALAILFPLKQQRAKMHTLIKEWRDLEVLSDDDGSGGEEVLSEDDGSGGEEVLSEDDGSGGGKVVSDDDGGDDCYKPPYLHKAMLSSLDGSMRRSSRLAPKHNACDLDNRGMNRKERVPIDLQNFFIWRRGNVMVDKNLDLTDVLSEVVDYKLELPGSKKTRLNGSQSSNLMSSNVLSEQKEKYQNMDCESLYAYSRNNLILCDNETSEEIDNAYLELRNLIPIGWYNDSRLRILESGALYCQLLELEHMRLTLTKTRLTKEMRSKKLALYALQAD